MGLARNEDIFFKLGWHVLKNRSFEEGASSFVERNASEATYFRRSIFKALPQVCVGIDTLRTRLSQLLFAHVKHELPKLREDLETALADSKSQLDTMGNRRATPEECKAYLSQLSLAFYGVCKAAVGGHYEGDYFNREIDKAFSINSPATIRRLRAVIQEMNTNFSDDIRRRGHKYHIDQLEAPTGVGDAAFEVGAASSEPVLGQPAVPLDRSPKTGTPTKMSYSEATGWVSQVLKRTRGRELPGNFNPLLVGELFWEQCSKWQLLAMEHVDRVAHVCSQFLTTLLQEISPNDIRSRLWSSLIQDTLKSRYDAAVNELKLIMQDIKSYPVNYNHYYTDTIKKRRQDRGKKTLNECIVGATKHTRLPECSSNHTFASTNIDQAVELYSKRIDPNMEKHSCEEALDCLFAIYKASQYPTTSQSFLWANRFVLRSPRKPLPRILLPKSSNATSFVALRRYSHPLWSTHCQTLRLRPLRRNLDRPRGRETFCRIGLGS